MSDCNHVVSVKNFYTLVKLKVIIMTVQILNASFYGFFFEKKPP